MPSRRQQTPPQAEEDYDPDEPWWRSKSLPPVREQPHGNERRTTQFEDAAPPLSDKQPAPVLSKVRLSRRAIAAILTLIAVTAAFIVLLNIDRFAVTRSGTGIRGARRVPEDAIFAASRMEGASIFLVHPQRAAAHIKQVPGVAKTVVHVRLPDQVIIDVEEFAPMVAWQGITTTTWLAETGAVVPPNGDPPLLQLVDASGAAADVNGKLRPHILTNLKALQAAGLNVTTLYYGAQEGLYFRSPQGWTVYLGNEGQMSAKMAALHELEGSSITSNMGKRIVDLRFDGRVQIR